MIRPAFLLVFSLVSLFAGCAHSPQPNGGGVDAPGANARYVPAARLDARDKHDGVEILTSVPLRHITAGDAERGLRGQLPEGVSIGTTGNGKAVLLQGPGPRVYAAVEALKKLDSSNNPAK